MKKSEKGWWSEKGYERVRKGEGGEHGGKKHFITQPLQGVEGGGWG